MGGTSRGTGSGKTYAQKEQVSKGVCTGQEPDRSGETHLEQIAIINKTRHFLRRRSRGKEKTGSKGKGSSDSAGFFRIQSPPTKGERMRKLISIFD